jgi:hypothetical protein
VRQAVADLQGEGKDIDYVELTGRTNAEVLDELGRSHIGVDQVWSDISLSVFAAEIAAFGRPPIVGGYGHDRLREILDPVPMAPGAYCLPEDLVGTLRKLVEDEGERTRIGRECRAFVTTEWSPRRVAERLLEVIGGDVRPTWICDPSEVDYVYGCGLDPERLSYKVRVVVDYAGASGLCLDDKPALRDAILDIARASGASA